MARQGVMTPILLDDGTSKPVIKATATVYTHSMPVFNSDYFGIWFKFTSVTGTAAIKLVQLEMSHTPPATEYASDAEWIVPAALDNIAADIADENVRIQSISPIPMKYMRLKIEGDNDPANPDDTIMEAYIFRQGEV